VMVIVEKLVEWRLAGETEVLGENLPQRHFVHHKSHMTIPGFEPELPRWESQWLTAWAMARPSLIVTAEVLIWNSYKKLGMRVLILRRSTSEQNFSKTFLKLRQNLSKQLYWKESPCIFNEISGIVILVSSLRWKQNV
jgi:hypothetical protein